MDKQYPNQPLLHFPCELTIKVFGAATPEFEAAVKKIIQNHIPTHPEDIFRVRPSKDGKYFAISITLTIENREQIDNIYRELSADPLVLMAL